MKRDAVPTLYLGFQRLIAEVVANPVLAGMPRGVADLLLDSRRETMRDRAVTERTCYFHLLIALAVADRRPLPAQALMREHMDDAESSHAWSPSRRPAPSRRSPPTAWIRPRSDL
ncbi:MAG: FCD domain-containing protein [Chloroflexota bacterium]